MPGGSSRGAVANVLDCDILERERNSSRAIMFPFELIPLKR